MASGSEKWDYVNAFRIKASTYASRRAKYTGAWNPSMDTPF